MPLYVKPFGFILVRVFITGLLFSLYHLLFVREKIDNKDLKLLAIGAAFGVAANQLTFFYGLSLTQPIHASIVMICSPILVLIISAVYLKEKLNLHKIIGISIGAAGAAILILSNGGIHFNKSTLIGDLFVLINAASYATYLVIISPLFKKYHPVTITKWIFTIGFFYVLPFGWGQFNVIEWSNIPSIIYLEMGYVIIFSTFLAYLFNMTALKRASPTVVSFYIYSQPILATIIAISLGKDQLTWYAICAATLLFIGVFLVSKKPKLSPPELKE